ncbi:hypothetical protein AKO1_006271 [Acrasis kona]|uniref:Uncharacterized protein n=1 Tax=Acrasis kona TaxID=1008807 RepID=A0AAW2YHC2_9EUKA
MSTATKSILIFALLVAAVFCQSNQNFVVGDGAGLFYRFSTSTQVVTCLNTAGNVVSTFNLPFVPTSAAIAGSANVAVVTGASAAANLIVTVNLVTGVIINSATTTAAQIVSGVKNNFIITASGSCYSRYSLNDFSVGANVICTVSATKFLGLLDDNTAVIVSTDASAVISTFDIRAFVDASVSASVNVVAGACNGVAVLARGGYIYAATSAGLLTRYVINAGGYLIASSSINLGVTGTIQIATDVCNNNVLTIVGTSNSGCRLSQVNLNTFVALNLLPININLSLLASISSALGVTVDLNVRAAVSGSAVLLANGNNACCVASTGGVVCNGLVKALAAVSASLTTCAVVNTGLNFGASL